MARTVTFDILTRLEGQGQLALSLEDGHVERAYFQVPVLRGFERFLVGRQAEYLPQLVSRINGFAPFAHHLAATKALDELFQVEPPSAAKKVRELLHNVAILDNHLLQIFYLAGPDLFLVGREAPKGKGERSLFGLGLGDGLGPELVKQVIGLRRELRGLLLLAGGKAINPVIGLPGGIAKPLALADSKRFQAAAAKALELALRALALFKGLAEKDSRSRYMELLRSEAYTAKTYYMALVDPQGRLNFYDGQIRVVDPEGREFAKFPAKGFSEQIGVQLEPWSYSRFAFLQRVGWKGFRDGPDSGLLAVGPLARLNAAMGMGTPQAQAAYEEFFAALGRPVHSNLAIHWARAVEMVYAAERIEELARDPELLDPKVRALPTATPKEGCGAVEAPDGTLIHHYRTDERGVVTSARFLLPVEANQARLNLVLERAAKAFFKEGLERVVLPLRGWGLGHA
ncbi:MAG: Ni/Fe hydrogenase subunit alpha [Candidatus Bipolaricaulia bacterium]